MIEMKDSKPGRKVPVLAISLACLFASLSIQASAQVKAPPLPPGSHMVRIQAGMNDDEVKREKRAHHHKGHHRKNIDLDDSDKGGKNGKDDNKAGRK